MPNNNILHIVSFNIPYPPNYGGIIDVFYKIKELSQLEIKIYLHCFEYDRPQQLMLEKYSEKVFYYKRASKTKSFFSFVPFIIKNRENPLLVKNLERIKAPILFEGLHTTFSLTKTVFKTNVYIRTHNIEHDYFAGLAKSESNLLKKAFYLLESFKLKKYEPILKKATGVFSISEFEQKYFYKKYGEKCNYIPAFHDAKHIENHSKKGNFILYHGDLRISDNIKAALFLIDTYKNSSYELVIASSNNSSIITEINKYQNISFESINNQKELEILFSKAHINTLITFQKTGIKLKLLNALYQGKFIIANTKMIADTGLENLCELANTKEQILQKTAFLFSRDFSKTEIEKRKEQLKLFSPSQSAQKIKDIIFKQ
jgi:hypothetical protein